MTGSFVMLASMIRNLLDNVLRFTPQGDVSDVRVYRQAEQAILQIEDAGPGIATDDMNRIFEPIFRGQSPRGEGTRFGLSIVKRIVDSLKGSIALENVGRVTRPGRRVNVQLPISTESSRKAEKRIERWSAFRTATASVRAPRANETWRCRPRRETPLSRLDAWDGTMDVTYIAGDAIKLDIWQHNARGARQ